MDRVMSQSQELLNKTLLENALQWFQPHFRQRLVSPIESHFPNYALPQEIQEVLECTATILDDIQTWPGTPMSTAQVGEQLFKDDPSRLPLFKQLILLYRRYRAASTESLTEKTFHLALTDTLEQDVKSLDALVRDDWFQQIVTRRLPLLKDYLPTQLIEAAQANQIPLLARQHDEKFHILQAPNLFLPDLAHFRAMCEDREMPLGIAFLDIDHFKQFNTDHTNTKVDRNLLPRFMQTVEAHVFHHGYAYRQGGDEYLLLIPSMSRPLCISFLDELRRKLADLQYPDIQGRTTVSIGLCIVGPDCYLTDRELLGRANQAAKFAKDQGRNRIATYNGVRFLPGELEVVSLQP
jgi:diguanylate cyclase (GGDEF)-like protein